MNKPMTPAEHYTEAARLAAFAIDVLHSDEGGYDDSDGGPSLEELHTRQQIREQSRADAYVYAAIAQVHATLARTTTGEVAA